MLFRSEQALLLIMFDGLLAMADDAEFAGVMELVGKELEKHRLKNMSTPAKQQACGMTAQAASAFAAVGDLLWTLHELPSPAELKAAAHAEARRLVQTTLSFVASLAAH